MTREAALGLLSDAGYVIEQMPPSPTPGAPTPLPPTTRGRISKDGQPLTLVIGVAANDPTAVAVANTAADQLRNVGISASVLALDPPALYGDALDQNRVDAIVGWHQAGGDLATALASRYGCPALEPMAVGTVTPSATPTSTPAPSTTGTPATPATRTSSSPPPKPQATTSTAPKPLATTSTAPPPAPAPAPGELGQAPSTRTGVCDRSIQPKIDAALDGSEDIAEVLTAVEPRLWNMSTVLPILQDTTIVAAGPNVQNVNLSGAVPVGIVGNAGIWAKLPH